MNLRDIQGRCTEDGDCLLWQGRVSDSGLPVICIGGSTLSLRKAVYAEMHGRVPAGRVISPICGNKRCLACEHLQAITPKRSKELAARRGAYTNPARSRKASMTLRAKSLYSDEVIEQIRQADTPKQAVQMTGVNLSYAYEIRNGTARREYAGNPFAGLGARA